MNIKTINNTIKTIIKNTKKAKKRWKTTLFDHFSIKTIHFHTLSWQQSYIQTTFNQSFTQQHSINEQSTSLQPTHLHQQQSFNQSINQSIDQSNLSTHDNTRKMKLTRKFPPRTGTWGRGTPRTARRGWTGSSGASRPSGGWPSSSSASSSSANSRRAKGELRLRQSWARAVFFQFVQ